MGEKYEAHFGYKDVASKTPPNADTVFHIGLMTKAIVSASIAILVDEGKVSWDTPLPSLFSEFSDLNTEVKLHELRQAATVADLLDHGLGLIGRDTYWDMGD